MATLGIGTGMHVNPIDPTFLHFDATLEKFVAPADASVVIKNNSNETVYVTSNTTNTMQNASQAFALLPGEQLQVQIPAGSGFACGAYNPTVELSTVISY